MESRQVWKFKLRPQLFNDIEIPKGAELISVAVQHGDPVLWALVEPRNVKVHRIIQLVPTGTSPRDGFERFIGTVLLEHDTVVVHVFDHGEK